METKIQLGAPEKAKDLRTNSGPFGQLPAWYVKCGILARLKPSEVKVFNAIVVLSDNSSHRCMSTVKTLSRYSGVCASSISRASKGLEMENLIKTWRKGYRVYRQVLYEKPGWMTASGVTWVETNDKHPRNSETYARRTPLGEFARKTSDSHLPNNTENPNPKFSDAAKSLSLKSDEEVSADGDQYGCRDFAEDPIEGFL